MYNVNLWGKPVITTTKKEYRPPSKCTFCGIKIADGDRFYAGFDRYKIYSETCDNIRCHQWFDHKVKKKRIDYKTYR